MIEEIRISDLGVIGDATLELGPGFTVVTGETGAGKTMIVTALGLLLGARADAGSVRRGASSAVVEGRWDVPDHAAVAERVQAHRDAGADHVCVQVLTADPAAFPREQWRRLAPALLTR